MTETTSFGEKWKQSLHKDKTEEFSTFVSPGKRPRTQRQLFLNQYYTFIRRQFGENPPEKTLEVGCGRGTVSLYFNLYDGSAISLTDISSSAIELAKQNLELHGAVGTATIAGADNSPFKEGSFDVVFSIGLLEHLDDYQKIVDDKFRVLKSGGMVASLNIPKKSSIQILNGWYRQVLKLIGKKQSLKADYYRNSHSPEQFKEAFQKAGFTEIEIIYMTPLPMFTPVWIWVEHSITYMYRFILWLRSWRRGHPFEAKKRWAQAHMIVARKP